MSSAIRRLQKDYLEYQANQNDFTLISAQPLEENLLEWHVNICAPDGPYANLPLHFILEFPDNYPDAPPKVKLCTRINHPNVFDWGGDAPYICLDLLKEYTTETKYEGWSTVYTVSSILLQLQSFLFSENVPQDYGGTQSLSYGNGSVVSSLRRIKNFRCKCGHHHTRPVPALPKAYYDLLKPEVSHTGSRILAQEGAVVNQNTVFWQEFPAWKTAAWDCGSLCKQRGDKLQFECKIDWGWNNYYQEDIRIGWGILTNRRNLKYRVIAESPADVGVHYWPHDLKVGDVLTTAIDLKNGLVWYAVNGKVIKHEANSKWKRTIEDFPLNYNLVPIFRFRACRLLLNFGIPTCPVRQFTAGGFQILEPPKLKAAPSPDVATWKKDIDTTADVFPPQVFQDIIEFLPTGDILNARSSCYTVRSLIEEAAIIPRREVHCFKTKQSWKETVLGIGLTCEKSENGNLMAVAPNMEFLALDQWESGQRASAWGEKLTDFLVLPVSRKHFNKELVLKYMQKFGAEYSLGGGHSANEILNIFSKLMNMCVVTMMKETQEGGKCNEKLLTGYTQFHHLLLALNECFPDIAELAQKRVQAFISCESSRHKKHGTPDLGKLLVMASLCPDLDWKKFNRVFFIECSTRRVLWYLKECGALADIGHDDEAYCQRVFELTEVSRCIVAFQVSFLKTLALPKAGETLSDVLGRYYLRYGQPRSADMESLFKQAKAIVNCKTWEAHLEHTGLGGILSGSELARILKASVKRSLKANYHRAEKQHGRGKLSQMAGNPSLKGLFRGAAKSADELDWRLSFYLPSTFFHQVKEVVKKISGSKVTLPSKPRGFITVGAYEQSTLSILKAELKKAFPYLSLKSLKVEWIEMEHTKHSRHEGSINELAKMYNVMIRIPKKFAFPAAFVTGSDAGLKAFFKQLEIILGEDIVFKTQDQKQSICHFCEMSFCGREGAIAPEICEAASNKFVCRFCWPALKEDLARKTKLKEEELKEKARAQEKAEKKQSYKRRVKSFLEDLRQGKNLPASFQLIRHAQVREGASLKSEKVEVLLRLRFVTVAEVVGNRARIVSPIAGWVTVNTEKGLLIDPQFHATGDWVHAFPLLGCGKNQINQVTTSKCMPKIAKPVVEQPKKEVKTMPARKNSIAPSEKSSNSSSDSGSTQATPKRKYTKIGAKAPKKSKKKPTGRAIIPGRSYLTCRAAVVRAELPRDSRYLMTLNEGECVYVEKVYPKAHRAKITSPVRGWISTWTKKGRLLQ